MKLTNKFIGISGATLMALSAFNATASSVFAETTANNGAEVENTIKEKQADEKATKQNDKQTVSVNKNSSIGPGYYSSNAGFQNIAQPSIFMSFYMASYQTNFLNQIKAGALASKAKGVLPSITAAQAIIESGWGTSKLSTLGNNLFGIKGSYNGQSITFPTSEYAPGRGYYTINAAFRKYPSWSASVEDHANFFIDNPRYHNILGKTDYHEVARLIQQDGYATAPNYAAQLINAIDTYGLAAWDHEAGGSAVASTPVGTVPEPEQIAQIVYKPGYGVLAFQNTGKSIAGSNYKFKDGTRWKVVNTKVINGEEMYLVGNNTYIPKKYTSHYDNGIITIHYQPNYGVNALHADGTQVQGSNKVFKTGTRWNVKYTRVINGEICYLVGNDEYIPKKYTQWGKGE
ncbi:glycoside hydrolase family 73 protein [Lactobacillus hominis]|uniref:Mannosyl-glycoprotein endo-beta-N-acetylglucosaminidase n=2 Tax=Lactobacillus hominis TaxID=1203033 RepID=I7JV19_9LACO|nr:glycoside hydrolase family 73 protein [Lactobacillus hominis]CCI82066.1 Mannosyl-glycoprotein endo-beta-N-acetylglucosaminidase [Lactobacillus hominis DSM 23910 = CRBIP 24.179]